MRRAFGVLAALLLVLLCAGPAAAAPRAPVDRRITDPRITESSGLAVSLRFPDVLWTHNDSGNPPFLYAIGRSGATRAAIRLTGEPDVDWEAITSLTGPANTGAPGGPLIAVGDIGDNNSVHPGVRVAIIHEPATLKNATVQPIRVLRLKYPDGPVDAETLMADPRNGILYIVSKTFFGADLFQVPESIWPGTRGKAQPRVSKVTTLKRVATLRANFITDGSFLPDGRMLLRGYGQVYVLDRPETAKDDEIEVLASAGLPDQAQGESIAAIDHGEQALIGSEGAREPVYRISVPNVPAGRGAPTLPPSSGQNPSLGTTKALAPVADTGGGVGDLRVWGGVVGGALALMALTGGVVLVLSRVR